VPHNDSREVSHDRIQKAAERGTAVRTLPIPRFLSKSTGKYGSIISTVKRRKSMSTRDKPHARSWLQNKPRQAFRGYPVATVAFYGPTGKLATKVAVSIILTENGEPDFLERWFSDGELDVRNDLAIGEQVSAFLKAHAPRSTVMADRIIGCPHEEGTDYPDGASCPHYPYWAGRDRFTHERIQ
jgi:hypothetical protein